MLTVQRLNAPVAPSARKPMRPDGALSLATHVSPIAPPEPYVTDTVPVPWSHWTPLSASMSVTPAPLAPTGPRGPDGPVAPVDPATPGEPAGPVAPFGPVGPVAPFAPVAPIAP